MAQFGQNTERDDLSRSLRWNRQLGPTRTESAVRVLGAPNFDYGWLMTNWTEEFDPIRGVVDDSLDISLGRVGARHSDRLGEAGGFRSPLGDCRQLRCSPRIVWEETTCSRVRLRTKPDDCRAHA